MKRKASFLLLFICSFIVLSAQHRNYFQQTVNYRIKVSLDDHQKVLDGFEEIEYINNAPDTLYFIWFHLWPNAYKNDRTAFSEQLLKNGRTDFYFSKDFQRGYINRLDFKIDGKSAKTEDSSMIDITKLILNEPLLPGAKINISTPFHEKMPFNFSRGGYIGNNFQVTQWYPKPAVYDNKGWHPIPYLDQGEFFSEFGTFDVTINVPENYIVAATGVLKDQGEKDHLLYLSTKPARDSMIKILTPAVKKSSYKINTKLSPAIPNSVKYKTLHYQQENVHDFAWFAGRKYLVRHDTLQLLSGRVIDLWAFYNRPGRKSWEHSIEYMKKTISSRSKWLGEYPYDVVTAVEANLGFTGGMEYPTITSISPMPSGRMLETLIEHEVGHNWNYGILGSDERTHPWMDEGINSYYDRRYFREISPAPAEKIFPLGIINDQLPLDLDDFFYRNAIESKKDQPIETSSEKFSELNYNLTAYQKSALWLELIEKKLGRNNFDMALQNFYEKWKFKHPYPQDFKNSIEQSTGKNIDTLYNLIYLKGPIREVVKRTVRFAPVLSFRHTDLYNYNFISPAIGYNSYDGLMLGGAFHNFTLPANKFQYIIAPLYGTKSKQLNGISRLQFHWNSYGALQQVLLSLTAARFSMNEFTDSAGHKNYLNYLKLVPSVRIFFREKDPRSTTTRFIQWKTFLLHEKNILFSRDTLRQLDLISYPFHNTYINQIKFVIDNHRALYPYRAEMQGEQSNNFAKVTFTGKYFFNYANGGGLNVRLFAGKFFYLGDKTFRKSFLTDRFHLNLTGANGNEDYTYSNYFIGRNDFDRFPSQQIMIRDGGFKVRSELLSAKIGKTDDWLSAINLQSDIPKNLNPLDILPVRIPLMVFLDIGTYADAFKTNATGSKFLYDAGFQISLIRNLVNIYIPVAYSKVYSDYFKSTIPNHRFFKKISFSIDLQNLNLRKFNPQILL